MGRRWRSQGWPIVSDRPLVFWGEVFELGYFADGQGAEFAGGDIEDQGAELDTFDFFDEETNGLEHAADLTVTAFDEGDFVPGVGGVFVKLDFGGRGFYAAVVVESDVNTGAEAGEGFFVGAAADFDEIFFGDVRTCFGEFLGEGAVVGEEE